jgi:beta-lactamase class D
MNQIVTFDVKQQLKDKFKTFTNWNYREISQKIKKSARL